MQSATVANRKPTLDPANPGSWGSLPSEVLFSLSRDEVEDAQREALARRFETLRPQIVALHNLASRQGVERVDTFTDAPPVLFDHRVYKSYPLNLVEQRKFDRMTSWLQRLTTHDLSSVDVDGVDSVDAWLLRLGDYGLSVGHTTGTSGKLSFLPRSDAEWPNFSAAYFEMQRALFGEDIRGQDMPFFTAGYRRTHYWLGAKLTKAFGEASGRTEHYAAHDFEFSADLLSLGGQLQSAEDRGKLDKLKVDPRLLEQREALIAQNNRREDELEQWLRKIANDFRGRRVRVSGTAADLVRAMLRAEELGIVLDLAPNSIVTPGGGMKGYADAPADWEDRLKQFFGVERTYMTYGMTECLGYAPRCEHGFYHFYPYTLPIVLDEEFVPVPREGVQTGRMALFDFLAESYWGGYITGDQVTIYWDTCACGRQGPRIDSNIGRYSELKGVEDDKISCAGTAEAYNAFMDFVAKI
jgi:hypothetical protein